MSGLFETREINSILCIFKSMFFNRSSAEPQGSGSGCHGLRQNIETNTDATFLLIWLITKVVLRPVDQLYGQVRTDWNQCFVMDCSLSHPAGHKPFTCLHSVLGNTWLNIHAVRWMRFSARLSVHVFTISQNLTYSLFVSSAVSELSSAWSINCFLRYVAAV